MNLTIHLPNIGELTSQLVDPKLVPWERVPAFFSKEWHDAEEDNDDPVGIAHNNAIGLCILRTGQRPFMIASERFGMLPTQLINKAREDSRQPTPIEITDLHWNQRRSTKKWHLFPNHNSPAFCGIPCIKSELKTTDKHPNMFTGLPLMCSICDRVWQNDLMLNDQGVVSSKIETGKGCTECGNTVFDSPDGLCPTYGDKADEVVELVNHPKHYGGEDNPYEVVKFAEAVGLDKDAYLFNVLKYIVRKGQKGNEPTLRDLQKAQWYLNRRVALMEGTVFHVTLEEWMKIKELRTNGQTV